MPPLVVHVIHRLDVGGLENGLVNLVNRMSPQRYRHVILCLAGFGATFRQRIARDEVEVVSLDKKPGKDVGVYARFWRQMRRLRPAVVHSRNLGTIDMQWVAAAAGVRHRVHGEHGWDASDPLGQSTRSLRIRRACRPMIHRYVPMSRDISHWLERSVYVAPTRLRQIYNGVDTETFRPLSRLPATLASESADAATARDRPLIVGTVGRLDPIKNQESLLRALRSICDNHPSLGRRVKLVIVGDGPLRGNLESASQSLGLADRVAFTGARSDTPEQFRAMDLFVLPSLNEGISNTILEAMATGLPVVAARVGGNPEVVEDGITGTLYDADAGSGLEAAVMHYLSRPDLRCRHGAAGRVRAVKTFGLDAMVQNYLDLYDELLASCSASGGTGAG